MIARIYEPNIPELCSKLCQGWQIEVPSDRTATNKCKIRSHVLLQTTLKCVPCPLFIAIGSAVFASMRVLQLSIESLRNGEQSVMQYCPQQPDSSSIEAFLCFACCQPAR